MSNFRSGDCTTDRIRASRDGNAYHIANEAKLRVDEYRDRLGIAPGFGLIALKMERVPAG